MDKKDIDYNHLQKTLIKYHNENYIGNKIGFLLVGNFDLNKTEELMRKYFKGLKYNDSSIDNNK